jgi:antitoxin VapB
MSLNIKNKEAHKLASQPAKLTGESLTEAVTKAVRESLGRLRSQRESGLAGRLVRIGKDCAIHLKVPSRSADHHDLLCDGKGLPK